MAGVIERQEIPRRTAITLSTAPKRAAPAVVGAGSIALAHAVNDSYAYILPPLLPVMLAQSGLTLGIGGALVAIQMLASSFLQPVFGHWADRSGGGRWMAWAGVMLSGLGAASLGYMPGIAGLCLAMLTTGIGAALFHPVSAALVAQAAPADRRGFWMSAYISAGNVGLGMGPLLVGLVLVRDGLTGTWLLFIPAATAAALMWWLAPARPGHRDTASSPIHRLLQKHWRVLGALIAVVAVRSWASSALVTFLPTWATELGAPPSQAAQMLTIFLVSGAIGGFVGGATADRLGRDRVVIGSLLLSVPFALLLAQQKEFGPTFLIAAMATGFFLNGSWISLTVRGQESVPGSIAMMSGLMLGLSIGLGALAVTPIGILAEQYTLGPVLTAVAFLPLVGAFLMRFVPRPPASTAPRAA
jgi:FSR family fosmidomycin resistance protein-like MFS transporter